MQILIAFKDWANDAPLRIWGWIMGLIIFVLGLVVVALWLQENFPPLYVWLGFSGVIVCFIYLGFIPYYRRTKRDFKPNRLRQREFSIQWVSENAYFLHEPNGSHRPYSENVETEATILVLDCDIIFKPMLGRIKVECLWLDIAGKIAKPSEEWKTNVFVKETNLNLEFDIPANIHRGNRTVKLMAIVDGSEIPCDKFTINIPQKIG